ncbi:alkene reductase [Leuconostoc pseudomesenteroides]|uniref:alkene reductase n=1 Tax=Leuconostoc pseudomesenteroides TaxID=33968 RepID=UPI002286C0BD|nr:alkene reductase [Leuconostoc pseudomesenteroides]WAM37651.1 alkene reductase [Leuconostoc pseudomesenteroides]
MNFDSLWTPIKVGEMSLPHRLVMAPMTRNRANDDGTVDSHSALYYSQRASMGLLITEGTQPSLEGQGYLKSPGIYTPEHIEAWKQVTQAVHDKGGKIFIQLMHAGRMNHPDNTVDHHQGVAPSAIAPENGHMFTAKGMQPVPVPRELSSEDIQRTIQDFRHAAKSAIDAGADGVEIHGANGYLIHEFLGENSNHRHDEYGGSIENKVRFALEVTQAIVDEIGADKVGFRISPYAGFSTIDEGTDGANIYSFLTKKLNQFGLAYLHILHTGNEDILTSVRKNWDNKLIVNRMGRRLEQIDVDVKSGIADLASVATWALANPDFVERLQNGAPLNEPDHQSFFGGGDHGYIDYPIMENLK